MPFYQRRSIQLGLQAEDITSMDSHNATLLEHPAQALGWLDLLATLMPETVRIEVSSYVLIVVVVALWVWRRCPPGGRRTE